MFGRKFKLKFHDDVDGRRKGFDYTFDYIVMPMGRITQQDAATAANETWAILRRRLERNGYTIAQRDGGLYVEDFPLSTPSIIEIMTSSTSGGNKRNRTTISAAFEDAMLGQDHKAPGINYRQVWARMVSQLIVKSEVSVHWGGKTDLAIARCASQLHLRINRPRHQKVPYGTYW